MKPSVLNSAALACLISAIALLLLGFVSFAALFAAVALAIFIFNLIEKARAPRKISTPYQTIHASRDWEKVVAQQNEAKSKE